MYIYETVNNEINTGDHYENFSWKCHHWKKNMKKYFLSKTHQEDFLIEVFSKIVSHNGKPSIF